MADLSQVTLDPRSDVPLYKQLAASVAELISQGYMRAGERLPATRELAGQLGLNRTTVSAAYNVLEQSGLIQGHVGRGSFVAGDPQSVPVTGGPDWESILPAIDSAFPVSSHNIQISFANSRPAREDFPLADFRRLCREVIDGPDAPEILQLGSPNGYPPLRYYLLEEARRAGVARSGDELIVTNGCQQALDLMARLFASSGHGIVIEDPVYHGLLRVFTRAGAHLIPVAVDQAGIEIDRLEELIQRERPRVLLVNPSFQNPTGATLTLERRKRIVALAQRFGLVLIENDIYSELRYRGPALPTLKELDESGSTILLRSYSKVSFPGLRVGWVIAPRPVIARLAEAKQISDLHSDQLSQAVLLRFAESGELDRHVEHTRAAGAERLDAVLQACERYLPHGATFTRPEGGMSLWLELPWPLTAEKLLTRVQERGVDFVPGRYFSLKATHVRGLRISFGGLSREQITRGIQILGHAAAEELAANVGARHWESVAAVV